MDLLDSPISAASVGATVGLVGGPAGVVVGSLVGTVVDVAIGYGKKKKARRQAKKAFYYAILKRYDTQVFISALERMGPAMEYVASLGLKPGTPEYEDLLVRKLQSNIGYRGNCNIDLLGPAPEGKTRPVVAKINRHGIMTPLSPHIDTSFGPKWKSACDQMYNEALKSWAEDKSKDIEFVKSLKEEKDKFTRDVITKILVNGGISMLLLGYSIRQKRKYTKRSP